jgi:hypothetical protein
MKIDVALLLSALLLVVSVTDFFTSRARSKRLEDRETAIEAKESQLEKTVEALGSQRRNVIN